VGKKVASIGKCPVRIKPRRRRDCNLLMPEKMGCWNEAAARAGCDPNTNDDCLCGPFLNAVTYCTAATCGADDNLGKLPLEQDAVYFRCFRD
jgi:hypothetical protein